MGLKRPLTLSYGQKAEIPKALVLPWRVAKSCITLNPWFSSIYTEKLQSAHVSPQFDPAYPSPLGCCFLFFSFCFFGIRTPKVGWRSFRCPFDTIKKGTSKKTPNFCHEHTVNGRNPFRTALKPWETVVGWYLQGNII